MDKSKQTGVQSVFSPTSSSSSGARLLFFLLSSLTTKQGQLENIPCSFLAQPGLSPGSLIKHKPFSSPSLPPPLYLSAPSPLSVCLAFSLPQQPLSITLLMFPPLLATLARHSVLRPLCLFVTAEVWYSHWDSLQSQSVQSTGLVIPLLARVNRAPRDLVFTFGEYPDLTVLLPFNNVPPEPSTAEPTDTDSRSCYWANRSHVFSLSLSFFYFQTHHFPSGHRGVNICSFMQTFTWQTVYFFCFFVFFLLHVNVGTEK